MAEPQSTQMGDDSLPEGTASALRQAAVMTLPEAPAEPSDDTPTVISKHPPLEQAIQASASHEVFSGSLQGRQLAHYELLDPIGVGGMAAVIRARDMQLDRLVALKILPPDMAGDPENVGRFHQEARAAARLDHENIARVFYCGEDQRLHFIAFEFVEGENLRTLLDRRGPLPVPEAVRYLLQIAAGLEHAASRGVVHRDIKPSNIIITPGGRAKLVDMGLARQLGPQKGALTHSGVTLGTFDYISPEQALEPRDADPRSDIYSLGCTFYHMLTGKAPVPDGTAAKKLHHHQHVLPVDPRQLNPEIPDEVAAILGRMMAKNPRDRYQRPLQLVQHLMQVAQKVGAANDLPEGVLFLDAPLPAAPRKRPLLLFGAGSAALVGVVLLLSLASQGPAPTFPIAPGNDKGPDDRPRPAGKQPAGLPVEQERDRLVRALTQSADGPSVKLEHNVALDQSVAFDGAGRTLTIESKELNEPRTLTLIYKGQPAWAGLALKQGRVVFRNLTIEVEASTGSSPHTKVAGITIAPGTHVLFDRCVFRQNQVKIDRPFLLTKESRSIVPLASVALRGEDAAAAPGDLSAPQVEFKNCYFQKGQAAIAVDGAGRVDASHCAFGAHGTLFHVRNDHDSVEATQLTCRNCSALVAYGPAFRLDDQARCRITLEHSIFSCPEPFNLQRQDPPELIRQTDSASPGVRFMARGVCYHNLNALWNRRRESGSHNEINALKDFREEVAKAKGRDAESLQLELAKSPWAVTPLQLLDRPGEAFKLNPKLAELAAISPLGVRECAFFELTPPVFSDPAPVLVGQKIVDPEASDPPPGVYRNVAQALAYAAPGDEILIKHGKDREVEVSPHHFDKPDMAVTFKPYPKYAPILTLSKKVSEPKAALFHLHDQKIHFEDLELELEVWQKGFTSMSVAAISGNGTCTFKRCILTMVEPKPSERVPLSIVSLVKPEKAMEMGGNRPSQPLVQLEHCLVRGEGQLVTVEKSRPARVELKNSLLVLTGSAISVQGGEKELKESPDADRFFVELSRVSAFLTDSLLHLKGSKNPKGLAFTTVEMVEGSLFVALENKPLVMFEPAEGSDQKLMDVLSWKGKRNAFCGYKELQTPAEDWRLMESEPRHCNKIQYGKRPERLSEAVPDQFQATPVDPPGEALPGASLEVERLPRLHRHDALVSPAAPEE